MFLALLAIGCSGAPPLPDAGARDAAPEDARVDAGAIDASARDAGVVDASAIDASAIDASAIDGSATDASAGDSGDASTGSDGGCLTGAGALGDACSCNPECSSRICIVVHDGDSYCSQICASRDECGAPENACSGAGGARLCLVDPVGTDCSAGGPAVCQVGICVRAAGSSASPTSFCSVRCTSAADCPADHACGPAQCRGASSADLTCIPTWTAFLAPDRETVLADYPVSERVCVPFGAPTACPTEADGSSCASGRCDGSAAQCTAQCSGASDCPRGACVSVDTSDARIPILQCDL